MKKKACTLLFLVSGYLLQAQSPLLDQWFLNNYLINPAIAGIERYADVQLGSRFQWTGVDGAPVTHYLSVHTPLGNPRPKKGFTKTPLSRQQDQYNYKGMKYASHHGIGGVVYYDQIGPFVNLEFNVSYAYHLAISKKVFVSAGVSAGLFSQSLQISDISGPVQSDPAVVNFNARNTFTLRPGVWTYGDQFYLGVSHSEFINDEEQATLRTSIFTAGYRFDSGQDGIHFTPYGMLRLNQIQNNYDVGMKVDWKRRYYGGATYRSTKETVYYLGASVNFLMSFTYLFYSGAVDSFTAGSGGTHEFQLNFRFNNKERIPCPQKMW